MSKQLKTLAAIYTAVLMSGCQAGPALPTAANVVQPVTAADVSQPKEQVNLRRVLDEQGNTIPASMWGINFVKDVVVSTVWYSYFCCWPGTGYDAYIPHYGVEHQLDYTVSGLGKFDYVGNGRILYKVPVKQMLVINEIYGGNVVINGLTVGTGVASQNKAMSVAYSPYSGAQQTTYATETPGRISVNYVFGPGDDIVITANPGTTIVGYTADPAFLAGQGGNEVEK
ncbi:MAG: hypothetical protein JWM80_3825 [Cyanobacteria bacterium RYN_339]|nr:hypothetical protein [Cyanobacteria bacterium RYN_339]